MSTPSLQQVLRQVTAAKRGSLTDGELLAQFTEQRDEEAFAILARRHGGLVQSVCRSVLHHQQDAEDAEQATFLVLARRAASIRKSESLAGWLHGVAYRVALKARAQAARRRRKEHDAAANPKQTIAEDLSWREVQCVLHEELQRLPEKYRLPLIACCLEGHTRDEAARQLGWTFGTLKGMLDRGRELLRKRLERRGVTLAAALATITLTQDAMSAAWNGSAPKAALAFLARQSTGLASKHAVALAETALKSAFPLKSTLAALLVTSVVLVGAMDFRATPTGDPPVQQPKAPLANAEPVRPHVDRYGDPLPVEAVARLGTLRLYHGQRVDRVILSPDAKLVVSFARSYNSGNRLWDAVTGRELPLKEELKMVPVFTAKGKLLALEGGDGIEMICRDLGGGGVVRLPVGAPEFPRDWPKPSWKQDIVSPDGAIRAVIEEKRIHLYDARSGKKLEPLADQNDGTNLTLAFSPDSKLLAAGSAQGVRLWDVTQRKFLRLCRAKDSEVLGMVYSTDGKTLAGADGNSVTIWDVATGKWRQEFHHTYLVGALAFTTDGQTLLSGSSYNDPIIRLWDPYTGREKGQWRGHTIDVHTIAVSPDGKFAVSGGYDRTIRLWDVATGKELRQLGDGKEPIWKVEFSPDGRTLAAGSKGVHLWDLATGKELRSFGQGTLLRLRFSLDGKLLATSSSEDPRVRLWDVASGRELRQFSTQIQSASSFSFSPDGRTLATGDSAGPICIWDLATGKELRMIGEVEERDPRAAFTLYPIAYSPDGRTLAAGYSNETVRLWEVASGQERARYHGHRSHIASLAFSPDGSLLASGSWDRTIVTWDVSGQLTANRTPGRLEAEALKRLWDDLANTDAKKAYRSIQTLQSQARQTVPFLREHLHPAPAIDGKRVAKLLADLDNEDFDTREQVTKNLSELGDAVEEAVRRALARQPSPEMRRRAERVLAQLDTSRSPSLLRSLRAAELLERIASTEATELLRKLAEGPPEARLTREAKSSLERLARRTAP
jgi:RNA polymerase sigma factor (sigma-70 family)